MNQNSIPGPVTWALRSVLLVLLAVSAVLASTSFSAARPLPVGGHRPPAMVASSLDAPDLATLLVLQRAQVPSAVVSASFYEWRAVSRYRRQAGLHLGYDVAMPAGATAVAGWTGQVTRVTQWYGSEYGITVVSPSGFEVTYGHLSPRVKVGDVLNPGDPVGTVVVDHVDVKMRGPDGLYFDFGHSTPPAAGIPGLPPGVGLGYWGVQSVPLTRAEGLRLYLTSVWTARLGEEEVLQARAVETEARLKYESERRRVVKTREDLPKLRGFLKEGLIARVELEQAEARVAHAGAGLAALEQQWKVAHRDVSDLQGRVLSSKRQADAARQVLSRMGVGDSQLRRALEASLEKPGGEAARLRKLKAEAVSRQQKLGKERKARLGRARQEMDRMQGLFEQGAVSRMERDRARQKYESLLRAGS